MAEKQVVRQDVVEIGFEVLNNPLGDLIKSMQEFQKATQKASDAMKEQGKKSKENASGLQKMADKAKDIKAKLQPALTKIDNGLKAIGKSAIAAGKKIASGLGNAAKMAIKGAAAGVAAFAGLAGVAVKNYAEYEQLVGGVETLFKDSKGQVMKYANDAYKTAGLSANAYMETVTSFSASLLQSVGGDTAKAAKLADQAIIDMSDNANKMGTDMEMIQNAYQGFAKQNYTMLDNLKLGYGGTKEEMQRLLTDAEKLTGKKFDLSSYADIVEAIHAVQENMGIAGTTSKEASTTIQGSLSAMKSAWSNFVTGMADPNQNFDQLVDNLIDSVVTFSKNLIPVIKRTVPRLAKGLAAIAKEIAPQIPPMLKTIGNKIVEYVPKLGAKFKELLLKAKDYLIANKGVIWDGFKQVVAEAIAMLSELFTGEKMDVSEIKNKVQEITDKIMSFANSIKEHWPVIKGIIAGVVGVIGGLKLAILGCNAVIAINNALTKAKTAGDLLMAAKTKILNSSVWASVKAFGAQAIALMTNPITWIVVGIIALIAAIILLVKNWDKVKEVALKVWAKIKEIWGKVSQWFSENVIQPVVKFFTGLWDKIKTGAQNLWSGICSVFSKVGTWIYDHVIEPVVNFFKGLGTVLFVIVAGIVGLLCQAFLKLAGWVNAHVIQPIVKFFVKLWNRIKEIAVGIWNAICSIWGKIANWVNTKIIQPVVNFFVALWNRIKIIVNNVAAVIRSVWGLIANWVNSKVIQPVVSFYTKLWNNIKKIVQKVWETICNIWGKISGWVNDKIISPIKDFFSGLWSNIKEIASGIKESIVNAFKEAWEKVTGVWNGLKDFFKGIWDGLKETGSNLKAALVDVFKTAVKGVAKPVNKLIGGANWVLEKLGSETRIAEWEPYARGTNGHPGGNAIVNDGRGAELVQMPNGQTFLPKGRNVLLPNAPKGMKVLDAERTAQLMGRKKPTFNYAGGIGDWEIWDFFDDAKGLVGKVIDKFVNYDGVAAYALDAGKALISKATSSMTSWVKNLFKDSGGKDIASYEPSKGVEQWRSTVVRALKMEGQHTVANVKRTLYQMQTESGGNPRAINNWDSNAKKGTPSKGLMQVIDPTFKAYARSGFNSNIYDPLSNILASVRYAMSRYGSLAKAYKGVGYAEGVGFPRLPSYSPASTVPVSRSTSTSNNYAPSFNLTMNGTVDRTTERTIKNWVMEALEEAFESMERTNPRLTEV